MEVNLSIQSSKESEFPETKKIEMQNSFNLSRLHFFVKVVETIFVTFPLKTIEISFRIVKLLTWDITKTGVSKLCGYHAEANNGFEREYLKTVRVARDILFTPYVVNCAFQDMIAKREEKISTANLNGDIQSSSLSINNNETFDLFSSYMYGTKTFRVKHPIGITEFAAESDGTLNTVMASHFLKEDTIAINFGLPNVASFVTESQEDDSGKRSIQTLKVDAKSLKREPMAYHQTNGKIQSGLFFVPKNLPKEALQRFKGAAEKLKGRSDITCVNTNCRVLEEAGFSIEGKKMDEVVFPTTLMEHFLFRDVFYTDFSGNKHKVDFEIINTTNRTMQEHFTEIDLAVLGTRLRHAKRHADTDENRKARGVFAKALIQEEKERLASNDNQSQNEQYLDSKRRKITVSVPSILGNIISQIWGRHTLYEVDLSDKKEMIAEAFKEQTKLSPFHQEKPSFLTRLKRDIFFSGPMIKFLRRHMMGRADNIYLNTADLFSHLKSTNGERINYVILDDKVVLAKVNANRNSKEVLRKGADWALSKHALLSGRENVRCSGELWYDEAKKCFVINKDSGTYMPEQKQLVVAAQIINQIFETNCYGNVFEIAESVNNS